MTKEEIIQALIDIEKQYTDTTNDTIDTEGYAIDVSKLIGKLKVEENHDTAV